MYKVVSIFALASLGAVAGAMLVDGNNTADPDKRYFVQTAAPEAAPRITAITADGRGHFNVAALVNGSYTDMIADTGATLVVLTEDDAVRAGIEPGWLEFNTPVQTANGETMTARITLEDVQVGGITLRDVEALVARPGDLQKSLLGMSFIGRLRSFELKGDQLVLNQ